MKDKREIAAISAVMALMNTEETLWYQPPVSGTPSHPWAAYGRMQTMQYRDLTQRRIIKRNR